MTLVHLQLSNQCTHKFIWALVFTEAAECRNKRERGGLWYLHKSTLYCLIQSPMDCSSSKHLHGGRTWMVNYLCPSSTPNPNPQSANIYNQLHILGFPCHMLVNSISIGKWMVWVDSVFAGKIAQPWGKPGIQDQINDWCMWTCEMSWCKLGELEVHAKSSLACDLKQTH